MGKKVLISGPAEKDLKNIITFIRLDKPLAAEKFKLLLKEKISSLSNFPEKGRKIPELKGTSFENYREFIVNSYRIFYKITASSINILKVFHGRRLFSFFE